MTGLPGPAAATADPVARRALARWMAVNPVAVAIAGALAISTSATLVGLAGVAPATAAAFRCLYALPLLAILAWRDRRRTGPATRRQHRNAAIAGVFFALDLVSWHHAIATAGAGIATVLGNLQVLFVGLGAWAAFGERPGRRLLVALPVVLGGVVLISGVVGTGAYGADPLAAVGYGAATSLAYAAFILVLRGRGGGESGGVAGPLFEVTLVTALVSIALGPVYGGVDLIPTWPAHGWLALLAVTSQVFGWLLITSAWRLLPAVQTSFLLLIQPVASVALAAFVLTERPSAWQLTGCAVVLAGVMYGSRGGRPAAAGDQLAQADRSEAERRVDDGAQPVHHLVPGQPNLDAQQVVDPL